MIRHNGKIILGVDLGNYNIKTENVCFPSAYVELAGDGNNYSHTLRYNGKYYALGGKRVAQRDDKASMTDDFLILNQFAIARELMVNGMEPGSYEIYLATALPPAYMNNKAMRTGLKQFFRRQLEFLYNGQRYRVNIIRVYVCPQGVSALYANVQTEQMSGQGLDITCRSPMAVLEKEGMAVLVDIGGGTVDPVVLQYGIPQPFEDEHPAKGIIWTDNSIRRDIKAKTSVDISEEAVNLYLNGDNIRMDEISTGIIREHIDHYANRLLMELREKGLPFATAYTLVQGGGAKFVRNAWREYASFAALDFLPEIKATAMGCEVIAQRMMTREEQKPKSRVS